MFSPGNVGFGLPGRFGVDYAFINKVKAIVFLYVGISS